MAWPAVDNADIGSLGIMLLGAIKVEFSECNDVELFGDSSSDVPAEPDELDQ